MLCCLTLDVICQDMYELDSSLVAFWVSKTQGERRQRPYSYVVVLGRIIAPRKCVLILRNCEYVILGGKKEFVEVIKVTDLEIRKLNWIIWMDSINLITWILKSWKLFLAVVRERCDDRRKVTEMWCEKDLNHHYWH